MPPDAAEGITAWEIVRIIAVVAAVVAAVYQYRAYRLARDRSEKAAAPLRRLDPDTLRHEGLNPPHPEYVDRGIDHAEVIRHRKLAFVGPSKTGKTREAVQTALAIWDQSRASRGIYEARRPLEVPTKRPEDWPQQAIVIIDDLPDMGANERTEREVALPTVLDRLRSLQDWLNRQCKDGWWIILTSRLDEWRTLTGGRSGKPLRDFKEYKLDWIEGDPERDYVLSVCADVGWERPSDELAAAFADANAGAFLQLDNFLRALKARERGRAQLTGADVHNFREHRDGVWEDIRGGLSQPERDLLDALGLLRAIGAPLYGPLAREVYCPGCAGLYRWTYRRALATLSRTWLGGDPDGFLQAHDSRLERPALSDDELTSLADSALRLSRRRQHALACAPALGALYRALDEAAVRQRTPEMLELALCVARRRLELTPDDPWAVVIVANAHLKMGLVRDRGVRLARAVELYGRALEIWTEEDFPTDWATTQNNLGAAWADLPTGDRAENLRRAIGCYEAALRAYTQEADPAHWAATQNNLGVAWMNLPTGDRGENLRQAIACFESALRVRTEEAYPADWAMTQNNLGTAWGELPTGDRAENLRRAIACFESALRVYTEEAYPAQRATTQNNLGAAWYEMPTGGPPESLRRAIACYESALRVHTEEAYPTDWARTQNNLGVAWMNLPTGDRGENLRRAIACYEAALHVYTEDAHPAGWAATQGNLGIVWAQLPTGGRAENLRQAIACFESALRVYTEEAYPAGWAMTQNNLGNAWSDLPTGDRGENLRRAIACYESALRVCTEEAYPQSFAETSFNRALAHEELASVHQGTGGPTRGLIQAREGFSAAARAFEACGLHDDTADAREQAARLQALLDDLDAADTLDPPPSDD